MNAQEKVAEFIWEQLLRGVWGASKTSWMALKDQAEAGNGWHEKAVQQMRESAKELLALLERTPEPVETNPLLQRMRVLHDHLKGEGRDLEAKILDDAAGAIMTLETERDWEESKRTPEVEWEALEEFWHVELPDILAQVSADLLDPSMAHALIHKAILAAEEE